MLCAKKMLPIAALIVLMLAGCAAQSVPAYTGAPADANTLTVYTSHKEKVYGPIIKEFEETTGIWVRTVTGGSNELLELIEAQREAPVCDVMFGGGVESLSAYSDCFAPYACTEADMIKEPLRQSENLYTPFSSLPMVIIYNTKLVQSDIPDGWASLLNERWRGRIAFANPAVSGSSYTAALTMMSALGGDGWSTLLSFAENLGGSVLPDSGDVAQSVADGSMLVGVTLEESALKLIGQGSDIAIVYPKEGTSAVPDGSALIAGAPHTENAKRFLEFVSGREVQRMVVKDFYRRSVRVDVLDPDTLTPESDMRVIDYDVKWASSIKAEFMQRWAEYTKERA